MEEEVVEISGMKNARLGWFDQGRISDVFAQVLYNAFSNSGELPAYWKYIDQPTFSSKYNK
jgi:hypothetical protein